MIFTGELVWVVVIAYQTFFPIIQFQKMVSRAVSKNNEGQGKKSKGTTVIMTFKIKKTILCNHLNLYIGLWRA